MATLNAHIVGSCPLAPDPSGQLDILGHDSHPLGVDSLQAEIRTIVATHHFSDQSTETHTKVGILEEAN